MAAQHDLWEYNRRFWQAIRQSTPPGKTCESTGAGQAQLDCNFAVLLNLLISTRQTEARARRGCATKNVTAAKKIRSRPDAGALSQSHGQSGGSIASQHGAAGPKPIRLSKSTGSFFLQRHLMGESEDHQLQGDLITRLHGHRDSWRADLQPQDPSWRHIAVIATSITPFVVEMLEMLHKREPHERSLEQSLFDRRVTCYGYYDHVIKERQLTISECVGTLDDQFANGILLLVDLVIVYGDYWTLIDLGGDGPLASQQRQPWLWLITCVTPCSAPLFFARHPCK
eukprot:SM000264S09757  [mRNA]  locus=s264:96277:97616:+ [translate_table: standard]